MPVANCNRPAGEQDYPVTCYIDKGMKKHEYNSRLQGDQHVPSSLQTVPQPSAGQIASQQ